MGWVGMLWYVLGMVCCSLGGTGSCGVRCCWICGVVCVGWCWLVVQIRVREQCVALCHGLFQLVCYQEGFAHGIPQSKTEMGVGGTQPLRRVSQAVTAGL